MAGITISPQFRESPEIANFHEPAFCATAILLIATASQVQCFISPSLASGAKLSRRGKFSDEGRKRLALAMKERWAAAKKVGDRMDRITCDLVAVAVLWLALGIGAKIAIFQPDRHHPPAESRLFSRVLAGVPLQHRVMWPGSIV
jgi:hypothetical protein